MNSIGKRIYAFPQDVVSLRYEGARSEYGQVQTLKRNRHWKLRCFLSIHYSICVCIVVVGRFLNGTIVLPLYEPTDKRLI